MASIRGLSSLTCGAARGRCCRTGAVARHVDTAPAPIWPGGPSRGVRPVVHTRGHAHRGVRDRGVPVLRFALVQPFGACCDERRHSAGCCPPESVPGPPPLRHLGAPTHCPAERQARPPAILPRPCLVPCLRRGVPIAHARPCPHSTLLALQPSARGFAATNPTRGQVSGRRRFGISGSGCPVAGTVRPRRQRKGSGTPATNHQGSAERDVV
jgi:hypothetical protein